jgi:hypothetical protein
MRAVNFFPRGFLPGLGNMRGTFGKILSMFLLFVDDFLIVGRPPLIFKNPQTFLRTVSTGSMEHSPASV